MRLFKILLLTALVTRYPLLVTDFSSADTLRMNDGSTVNGIVVEDYKDRVVLSTVDGEKTIMKSGIGELYYDSEEENLIKLAEQAKERRDYARAFGYYNLAYKKNPLSKAAKDGFVFLQGYLFRQEEKRKVDDIKKRGDFEQGLVFEDEVSGAAKDPAVKLKDAVGITLVSKDGMVRIDRVRRASPADESGIKEGDHLVAVWGRLVGYMAIDEIINMLLDKPSLEIKCTIRRTLPVDPSRAGFGMDINGLKVVSVRNGNGRADGYLKKDDIVTAIDGKPTRYMPLKKAMAAIRSSKPVKLTVDRELLIWRKD